MIKLAIVIQPIQIEIDSQTFIGINFNYTHFSGIKTYLVSKLKMYKTMSLLFLNRKHSSITYRKPD